MGSLQRTGPGGTTLVFRIWSAPGRPSMSKPLSSSSGLSRAGWIQPSIRRHSSWMKRHFS